MVSVVKETRPEALIWGVHALLEKKAESIVVLDVRGLSSITDYLVITSGTSSPHLRALRTEIEKEFKDHKIDAHIEGNDSDSGWLVLDAFDVMFHIFHPELRDYFRLEHLWKDGKPVPLEELGFNEQS